MLNKLCAVFGARLLAVAMYFLALSLRRAGMTRDRAELFTRGILVYRLVEYGCILPDGTALAPQQIRIVRDEPARPPILMPGGEA